MSSGKTVIMTGTNKGAFIFTSNERRKEWKKRGPFFASDQGGSTETYHLQLDHRNRNRIYACVNSGFYGPVVCYSDNLGRTWRRGKKPPRFSKSSGLTVKNLWHIALGRENEPDILYLGLDPHGLFKSEDRGQSWGVVESFTFHDDRKKWSPGNGGPCLHTIIHDPRSRKGMWVGMSAAGVYHTRDFETWTPMNRGIRADFRPDKYPTIGQCVHKFVLHPEGRVMYLQNHGGVYRSDDYGLAWRDIGRRLPSDFGFPVAVHPHDHRTVYVVPLEEMPRFSANGEFAVYRSKNMGKIWERLSDGLPKEAYLTVVREGMCVDAHDPVGVYVGTKSGKIFYSRDEGDTWQTLADNLPAVLSVTSGEI